MVQPMRRVAAIVVASVLQISCAGGESGANDTAGADTVRTPAGMSASPGQPPRPAAPPVITRPLREMRTAEAWRAVVHPSWLDSTRGHRFPVRHCGTMPDADPPSRDCALLMAPVWTTAVLDLAALTPEWAVLGRVQNVGTRREAALGIEPGAAAYWIVRRAKGGRTEFALVDEIGPGTPKQIVLPAWRDGANFELKQATTFSLGRCQPGHPPATETHAGFYACSAAPHAWSGKMDTALVLLPERAGLKGIVTSHETGPWFSCKDGCCTVTAG